MNNEFITGQFINIINQQDLFRLSYENPVDGNDQLSYNLIHDHEISTIQIFIPVEIGAGFINYSNDIAFTINNNFGLSFEVELCPVFPGTSENKSDFKTLDLSTTDNAINRAIAINENLATEIVVMHYSANCFVGHEESLLLFATALKKPLLLVMHGEVSKSKIKRPEVLSEVYRIASKIIFPSKISEQIFISEFNLPEKNLVVIPYAAALPSFRDKLKLKSNSAFRGKKLLLVYGDISGLTDSALIDEFKKIIRKHHDALLLIIPEKQDPASAGIINNAFTGTEFSKNVLLIEYPFSSKDLTKYLQICDICFLMGIPEDEILLKLAEARGAAAVTILDAKYKRFVNEQLPGIFFKSADEYYSLVTDLLGNPREISNLQHNLIHDIAAYSKENTSLEYVKQFMEFKKNKTFRYSLPAPNMCHIRALSEGFGMMQFASLDVPDEKHGYTLDDTARALVAVCMHYSISKDEKDFYYIGLYLNFIKYCLQSEGYFLNYVDVNKRFTSDNDYANLADANGRAIWALGYLVSMGDLVPENIISEAESLVKKVLKNLASMHSTRAMAFSIKGLYFLNKQLKREVYSSYIKALADRLVQMYRHEAEPGWEWYEGYLTYANSIIPEALLYAYLDTHDEVYRETAKSSFRFLLKQTFTDEGIKVISNQGWRKKGEKTSGYGEQPIDVSYTVMALTAFYQVFGDNEYLEKAELAFTWFLGNNHLRRSLYNPVSGGSYDGLEKTYVNLNQGAESSVSYMMARLSMDMIK